MPRSDGPELATAMIDIIHRHREVFTNEEYQLLGEAHYYLWHHGRSDEEILALPPRDDFTPPPAPAAVVQR